MIAPRKSAFRTKARTTSATITSAAITVRRMNRPTMGTSARFYAGERGKVSGEYAQPVQNGVDAADLGGHVDRTVPHEGEQPADRNELDRYLLG